jgi:hypothetical protein
MPGGGCAIASPVSALLKERKYLLTCAGKAGETSSLAKLHAFLSMCTRKLLLGILVGSKIISRRVGHLLTSTTTDIYAHVDKTEGANLSDVFHQILERNDRIVPGELHEPEQLAQRFNVVS